MRIFGMLLCSIAAAGASLPAGAQQADLLVAVTEAETAEPVEGAWVGLGASAIRGITDADGTLRISGVAAGPRRVEVRLLGYGTHTDDVIVPRSGTVRLRVALRPAPIALEPVKVVATPSVLLRHGFYRRMEGGVGTFLTRTEIERMGPRTMGDILRRLPGLSVTMTRYGATARSRGGSARCPIQYYLDGVTVPALNVDFIPPEDLEGLEVYRGAASIPAEFNRGTALCGVILIWTRVD